MVAILGTGTMGLPMAHNLRAAGLEVRAWNRTRGKAKPLTAEGVEVADSPAEAVHGGAFVITMLADGGAVSAAIEDGAVQAQMGRAVEQGHGEEDMVATYCASAGERD